MFSYGSKDNTMICHRAAFGWARQADDWDKESGEGVDTE
jgi:hypothetical protein